MEPPEGLTVSELVSFYATVVNRIAYASLEEPRVDGRERVTFDIVWLCGGEGRVGAGSGIVLRGDVVGL